MLKIAGISKSFIQRGTVLDNLSLEIEKGEMISVSGPSGSGKTTLLNLIGALDRPDSGEIWFRESSVGSFSPDQAADYRNSQIGFVFQDHMLLQHLTIHQNILLPVIAKKRNNSFMKDAEEYVSGLMETVGISELASKYPFQVSGGEAQRASLLRALVNKPSILLADEPTGSLDKENAGILGDLLRELNIKTGVALLVVTHSDALAAKMTRRLRLQKGILIPE